MRRAAAKDDPRPLWVLAWGGANTLAQALTDVQRTSRRRISRSSCRSCASTRSPIRTTPGRGCARVPARCTTSHAVDAGRRGVLPATWTGISGDRFYRNAPGADFTTFTDDWVNANIRARGPLGALYSAPVLHPRGRHARVPRPDRQRAGQRDEPAYGGWGGRYVWRQPSGETRPFWTQGGDSYPGRDSSRDTVDRHRRPDHTTIRRRSGAGARPSSTTSRRGSRGRSGAPAANHNPASS
jgi:hypothetical protein